MTARLALAAASWLVEDARPASGPGRRGSEGPYRASAVAGSAPVRFGRFRAAPRQLGPGLPRHPAGAPACRRRPWRRSRPSWTALPSFTETLRRLPPVRARAGTTIRLITRPKTAFVSTTSCRTTSNSRASAGATLAAASMSSAAIPVPQRLPMVRPAPKMAARAATFLISLQIAALLGFDSDQRGGGRRLTRRGSQGALRTAARCGAMVSDGAELEWTGHVPRRSSIRRQSQSGARDGARFWARRRSVALHRPS